MVLAFDELITINASWLRELLAEAEQMQWHDMREKLQSIIDYPTEKDGRRTEDGYPEEIIYDEFAYKRIVNSYRKGLKALLDELPQWKEK